MRMRMPWYRELKWLLAMRLAYVAYRMTEDEACLPMLEAWHALWKNFDAAEKYKTVPMRTVVRREP